MNHRALHLQVCFLVLFVAGGVARAQEPRLPANIRGLSVNYKNGSLLVSFRVEGAFSPPVLEKLASASAVKFVHKIRVVRRRGLFGRTLDQKTVETTARYDNLTRQYALDRAVDGTSVESRTTDSDAEMRRFMTEVHDLPVGDRETLSGEEHILVKVRSEYEDTWLLFLFPWTYHAEGEKAVDLKP